MSSTASKMRRVVLIQPASTGGNFEYVAVPRQGMLFLSAALKQWKGRYLYEREIWFEDRCGRIDPHKDLEGVDALLVTCLINEAPRAFEIARDAKKHHPQIITVGGGPQIGPLPDEAMHLGNFDAVVNREGEDIIGELCDVLLSLEGRDREQALGTIPGISFLSDGHLIQTHRKGTVAPDFVELPDFHAIRDLTPVNPMAGGVIETVRGCTEKCTYCQVIKHFLGYRMIKRETELKRLTQLQQLAADGLIYSHNGQFSVFVSDDLHPPPARAVAYRNERLARIKAWKPYTKGMRLICQARAEVGQDAEVCAALRESGMEMLYLGIESGDARNLDLVKKRQDPGQVYTDMVNLKAMGFVSVAMTIIGLPFDTEESIMNMADWVRQISRYQTANFLTPLPSTSNWDQLIPLDENGEVLPQGTLRPYQLYTGAQLVHKDERWTLQSSRDLFSRYNAKLRPVDEYYARLFKVLQRRNARVSDLTPRVYDELTAALTSLSETTRQEISHVMSRHPDDVGVALRSLSAAALVELEESIKTGARKIIEAFHTLTHSSKTVLSPQAHVLRKALQELDADRTEPAGVVHQTVS